VRRLALAAVVLLALAFAVAASARNPRAEKLRLNARDNRAARASLITLDDLSPTWQSAPSSGDDTVPSCPGYRPDFSKYTITGKAESDFREPSGAVIASSAEIYASHAQATGDYRLGAKPQVASCLAATLEKQPTGDPTVHVKTVSAKEVASPGIGERSARYKIVLRYTGPGGSVRAYIDAVVFQKGRTLGLLLAMGVKQPITDGVMLARRMYARSAS
jgi:hypothetical protein